MGWSEESVRSEEQIEADIREELEFHLEQRTRELVAQGMGEGEARAEAERRFGSIEGVRASCRWVQMGERIMLQRINFVLNLVLAAGLLALGWTFWQSNAHVQDQLLRLTALLEPRAAELAPAAQPAPNDDLEPFRALKDAAAARALAEETVARGPDEAWWRLQSGWPLVADPKLRLALIGPFVENGGHAHAIEVLDVAANDRDPEVRARAFRELRNYAWQDFSTKPVSLYHEWYLREGKQTLVTALADSVAAYRKRLGMLHGAELLREIALLGEIDLAPGKQRDYDQLDGLWWDGEDGARTLAAQWLSSDDSALQLAALRMFALLQRDPDFARDNVMGFVVGESLPSTEVVIAACHALAASGRIDLEPYNVMTIRLLRLCIETDTPEARQAIGSEFLARLWKLPAEPVRGAAEWSAWWKQNRGRFQLADLAKADAQALDAR